MPLLGAVHPGQLCSRENIHMPSRDRFVQSEDINLHSLDVMYQSFKLSLFPEVGAASAVIDWLED